MATVIAQSNFIFGLRKGVTNNLCFLDDQTVVFPSGNNCIRYNIDQKWQKFIPGTERSLGLQAMALSANRRYLAVSESGEKPTITVYDLTHEQGRKRKLLTAGDSPAGEFLCMAFSPNSKYLVGQSGGPTWTLVLWLWERQKVLATVSSSDGDPVSQVSFNPLDDTQLCVSGPGLVCLLNYREGVLKRQSPAKVKGVAVLCHAWVSGTRVVAGTDQGRLLMVESGELRSDLDAWTRPALLETSEGPGTTSPSGEGRGVTAILAYSKGFMCSVGPGTVCVFENTEEMDSYRKTRELLIPPDPCSYEPGRAQQQQVATLCLSPGEDTLALSTQQGQLYAINLISTEISRGEPAHFEFLSSSFHTKSITGLSVCIRKPLVASCSLDRSVRVWNYDTNVLELYKEFQEEALSVSLHPSGLFLLVGFTDKLRVMNLLIDDIRTVKEFTLRGCPECVFSHGGHLFAAINGNVVHIYSVTTFDNMLTLKGHNGKSPSSQKRELLLEYSKNVEQQRQSAAQQEENEGRLEALEHGHARALGELRLSYQEQLQHTSQQLASTLTPPLCDRLQVQAAAALSQQVALESRRQAEEDSELEVQTVQQGYEERLYRGGESYLTLKGEAGIMRKQLESLRREVEERCEDIERLKKEAGRLQGVIRSLETDILGLKKEISERVETIQDKERVICDQGKKNQELEKISFLRNSMLEEQKKSMAPRDSAITEMKAQIQEMEAELKLFHEENTQLELHVSDLKLKLRATAKERNKEMQKVKQSEGLVRRFQVDLHRCAALLQEPGQLKKAVQEMYGCYIRPGDVVEIVGVDEDIQREWARQRDHLEKTVSSLKVQQAKDSEQQQQKNLKLMRENTSLIQEINELRTELQTVRPLLHSLQLQSVASARKKGPRGGPAPQLADRKINLQKSKLTTGQLTLSPALRKRPGARRRRAGPR
ncbi:unnamed protein product [Arctogadus glacialis]